MGDKLSVVITGVEGGGVTLYGVEEPEGWRFTTSYVDQTPLMLDELEIRREASAWVDSWDAALMLLDGNNWLTLPPVMVRREFAGRVWAAVSERWGDLDLPIKQKERWIEKWRDRCGVRTVR